MPEFLLLIILAPTERKRLSGSEDIGDTVGCPDEGQTDRLLMPVDLFVRNLSFKTTDETLKNFFEKYGEVQYAEVCTYKMFVRTEHTLRYTSDFAALQAVERRGVGVLKLMRSGS